MNTTPFAVAGRCRATTRPATSTVAPSAIRSRSDAEHHLLARAPRAAAPSGGRPTSSRSTRSRPAPSPSGSSAGSRGAAGGSSGSESCVPASDLLAARRHPEPPAATAAARRSAPPRLDASPSSAPDQARRSSPSRLAPEREARSAIPRIGAAALALADQRLHLLLLRPLHVAKPDPHRQRPSSPPRHGSRPGCG